MRYAQIRKMDISNGAGVGISLFVQGCHFHCKGCFNQETWDFAGGKEWTEETEEKFLSLLDHDYVIRVSILGGEPMEERNIIPLTNLLKKVHTKRPDVEVWIYTGYVYENLIQRDSEDFPVLKLLEQADYLVDGPFKLELQDVNHIQMPFAGSLNQRVLDLKNM